MSIIEFSDWEDAQRKMRDAETKANASVTDRQREIVYGSHWLRAAPDGMLEYGWVIPQDIAERNATKESIRALRDAYERGYRFSRAHSVLSTGGELGDTHLAVMWPITEEEFELAFDNEFARCYEPWEIEMLRRVVDEMSKAIAHPSTGSPQEES